jgi:phage terminase large subunit-like protein
MEWTTACLDWESRIVRRESLIPCKPLFPAVAADAWAICSEFILTDVAGMPTMGEATRDWMKDMILAIFGAEDPESGRRYINEFFWCVSKKNAKSTGAAGIMLTALLMNWRQSAELLILSPTKEIAENSYKPISEFINADEELRTMLKVQDYFRTITHRDTGATLKVVAADSDTVSGKKASFVFVDELHEFGKQARAAAMLLEATGGLTSRPEGFVIYATTQSSEPPAGVFKTKLDYARKVRDGIVVDKKFLPLIYEFPKTMVETKAYEDLNNAYVTNPNWGASVDIERITQLHRQAKEEGEQAFKDFMAKHLNVEIGLNLRSDRWAGADYWEASVIPTYSLEDLVEQSEVVTLGIDGGGLDDLLGFYAIGRCKTTRRWLGWAHAWAHPSVLERRKSEAPRFLDFKKDGDLTIVDRVGADTEAVADLVSQVYSSGKLDKVGCDPSGIGAILDALAEAGIPEEMIVGISQGWKMTGAIKTAERKLAEGVLVHGGQPLMAWCVGNAKIEPRGNGVIITKQASGTAKIDPLMALLNAVSLMALNPAPPGAKHQMFFV